MTSAGVTTSAPRRLIPLALPGSRLEFVFHINHRSVEEHGGGHALVPYRSLRIHGNQIPQDSRLFAALLFRLWRAAVGGELLRHDVIRIPILLRPPIRRSDERERRRRRPIGREDRFPHDEHSARSVRVSTRIEATAEDPRRQVAHVGDSSDDQANAFAAWLKSRAQRLDGLEVETQRVQAGPPACCACRTAAGPATAMSSTTTPRHDPRTPRERHLRKPRRDHGGDHLRKQRDEHDDRRRDREDGQRAARFGSSTGVRHASAARRRAPTARRRQQEPDRDRRKRPRPRLARCGGGGETDRQAARQRRERSGGGSNRSDPLAMTHRSHSNC